MTLRRLLTTSTLCALALLTVLTLPLSQPRPAEASSTVSMTAAGNLHTCALLPGGAVKCWGDNTYGQLGDGTTTQRNTPVSVCASGTWNGSACTGSALSGAIWIAAGGSHTCAVMSGGGAKCWGRNTFGELGDGTTTERHNPVDVCASGSGAGCSGGSAVTSVLKVTGGDLHTCALMSGTGIKCWGNNGTSQLGDGTATERHNPVDVCASGSGAGCGGGSALTGATLVSAGNAHTCAMLSGGVKCWGYNFDGELGDGNLPTNSPNPVDVLNNSVTAPDTGGFVGYYSSLALDASGHPVVSYLDATGSFALKVLHCNDANCAGGDESTTSPDTGGFVGYYSSLALDASGFPVVSYYAADSGNGDLKVLHCNDANCTGGDESVTSPDIGGAGDVGYWTSLALDASGNPVVSYEGNADLKVLHCGNPNCTAGNSITSPDTAGVVGDYTSLALDAGGNPVVSYHDVTNGDLKVLHCGNANCTAGNSINAPDTGGSVGAFSSLALDAGGNPVVSYQDAINLDLKVLHCNDANCAAGGDSITSPDTGGDVGEYTSLALDGSGDPVVSYRDATNGDLKVLRCGDANCSAGNTTTSPDSGGNVGDSSTSLALDAAGKPVVSYFDFTNSDLKVLHCGNANCSAVLSGVTWLSAGGYHNCAVVAGGEVRCWGDNLGGQLGNDTAPTDSDTPVSVCANAMCSSNLSGVIYVGAGAGHSCAAMPGNTAKCWGFDEYGQLADGGGTVNSGTPRNVCANAACSGPISNLAAGGGELGQYHGCAITIAGNVLCAGRNNVGQLGNGNPGVDSDTPVYVSGLSSKGGQTITTVDSPGNVGTMPSIALDASGNPVISYWDSTTTALRVLHCGNPSCTSGNVIALPDTGPTVGSGSSIALAPSGNPVVSYISPAGLKVLYCGNPTCTSGNTISNPDGASLGDTTSIALDGSGNAVVSYYDFTNGDLKLLHCTTIPTCASKTIKQLDGAFEDVGRNSSLVLDASGHAVISYYDSANGRLKIAHCDLVDCTGGITFITPDTASGNAAYGTSLALDASGNPVVAYNVVGGGGLKVLHCGDANCSSGNTITSPDMLGGGEPRIRLDASGNPVVSSGDGTNGDLRVLHCGNPNCTGGNTIATPDGPANVGSWSALAIDSNGWPIVAYTDSTNLDLKVLHCGDPTCGGTPAAVPPTSVAGTPGCHTGQTGGGCPVALGDGGPATAATLYTPTGLSQNASYLYIADTNNCRIRQVDLVNLPHNITTVAGTSTCNYNGEFSDARNAQLNHPHDVFLVGTTLYIADTDNCRVRKVENVANATPGPISTVAGGTCSASSRSPSGSAAGSSATHPTSVLVDSLGNVYSLDTTNCKLLKGTTAVVGTGTCGPAGDQLNQPNDITLLDPTQSIAIADSGNNRIRVYDPATSIVTTVAGTGTPGNYGDGGPATQATLSGPNAVTARGYRLYIADAGNKRVRRVNVLTNTIVPQLNTDPETPTGLSISPDGTIISFCTGQHVCDQAAGGGGQTSDDTRPGNFVPTSGCGLGSVSTIDWTLPAVFLGVIVTRRRLRGLWRSFSSLLAPRRRRVAGRSAG